MCAGRLHAGSYENFSITCGRERLARRSVAPGPGLRLRSTAKRGQQGRFKLKNIGQIDHEIVLATFEENMKHAIEMQKNPDMEHDDPNAKRLSPDQEGEIVWHFTKAGEFDFSCLIPGHRESGMAGIIIVQ